MHTLGKSCLLGMSLLLVLPTIAHAQATAVVESNIGDANYTVRAMPMNAITGPVIVGDLTLFGIFYNRQPQCFPLVSVRVLQIAGTFWNRGTGTNHFRITLNTGPILHTCAPADTETWTVEYSGRARDHAGRDLAIPGTTLTGRVTWGGSPIQVGPVATDPIFDPDPSISTPYDPPDQSVQLIVAPDVTNAVLIWEGFIGPDDVLFESNTTAALVMGSTSSVPEIGFEDWNYLQDTFPFNEGIGPGTSPFDTTTALIKAGINLARDEGGQGVIPGDSLSCRVPYAGGDTRVDLLFRILPGPGNYQTKGIRSSPLVEKDPSHPFWASYLANNGSLGTPGGHGGTWNPNVWNSARMDSAEANLSPIVSRGIGLPVLDQWMGTLHESDPRFNTLGIVHNQCHLVNSAGPEDYTNICCSDAQCGAFAVDPSGDPRLDVQPTTREGTKILPDGYFSPGTHIEYVVRRSSAANPLAKVALSSDTTGVFEENGGSFDGERWPSVAVLPDLWKNPAYGGTGLACMLIVDAADSDGEQLAVAGALDSLGYGKNNGASRGWKDGVGPVPANLGEAGLSFDWYDILATSSGEGGHPGSRYASVTELEHYPGVLTGRQSKAGPSLAMLETYYNTIVWIGGKGENGIHDGQTYGMQANDILLLRNFVQSSTPGSPRALWLAGEDAAEALASTLENPDAQDFLSSDLGAVLAAPNYRSFSGNNANPAVFDPIAGPFHAARQYGIADSATADLDVVVPNSSAPGAIQAARYEDSSHRGNGGSGPYGASVYDPANPGNGRYFRTLLDGFTPRLLLGDGPADSQTDIGRHAWMGDALTAFGLCAPRGPVIDVGEGRGIGAGIWGRLSTPYPNPLAAGAANIDFELPRATAVTIRFYNVAGRLVDERRLEGKAGRNRLLWNGVGASGKHLGAGIYLFRLVATGVPIRDDQQGVVLLRGKQ